MTISRVVTAAAMAAVLAGCGGSNATPSGSNGGGNNNPATTITITSSGVSPKTLTVSRGTQVTVVNSDSRAHDMSSDPHPTHENCPELNTWGLVSSGQSRQSSNLNTARTCTYHDHNLPNNASLQGTIVIQP